MARRTSPYVVGRYWLDFRTDGRAKGIWQIASYNPQTRSTNYHSTREIDLERAKAVIRAFIVDRAKVEPDLSREPMLADAMGISLPGLSAEALSGARPIYIARPRSKVSALIVPVAPQIMRYWEDHGRATIGARNLAAYLRAFLGFIKQDAVGAECTFDDLDRQTITRFRDWSMKPHEYEAQWYGRQFRSRSRGLSPSSFKKRLAALKAALNHAVEEGIVPSLRRFPKNLIVVESKPRTRPLSVEEVGAILG